ncbi:MAG: hypothetical protein HY909_07555 [Deltaproteobacteria bacterium]|nr:hypothetical protein [Deltaproteobacteria bacterium]
MIAQTLRNMLKALNDVTEKDDTYEMGEAWDVTFNLARQGVGLTINHVLRVTFKGELLLVVETARGTRWVISAEDLQALNQEPSSAERRGGRKTGFA